MDNSERIDYLSEDPDENAINRHKVTVMEIWTECYKKAASDLDNYKAKEIRKIMASFKDWEADVVRIKDKVVRGYKRVRYD